MSSRNSIIALVQRNYSKDVHCRCSSFQHDPHSTSIYICKFMGLQTLHYVRHPFYCFSSPPSRHRFCYSGAYLSSVSFRRSSMVVEVVNTYHLVFTSFHLQTFTLSFNFRILGVDALWLLQCRSFFYGGSAGLFVYGYCFDYYAQSSMSSFIQKSFFFGYMACICYGIFLALGTVGFLASVLFVRHIYGSMKCEQSLFFTVK